MKILILTIPFGVNYGGVLQAYALQKVLRDMGHDAISDNKFPHYSYLATSLLHRAKRAIKKYVFLRKGVIISPAKLGRKMTTIVTPFIDKNIRTIDFDNKGCVGDYDTIVIGSDQVWRPRYIPNIKKYFLEITSIYNIRRISYAASFGRDDMTEFSSGQLSELPALLQKFDAVSVREDTGVELCKQYFDVEAKLVLDPTMLLEKDDYLRLVDEVNPQKTNILTTYILDTSNEKNKIISLTRRKLSLTINNLYFDKSNPFDITKRCRFSSINEWLAGFRDAKFIVTDSFHGTVFAIIFNKPFIAIGNSERGLARFSSLLKLFKLEERLVFSIDDVKEEHFKPIDFEPVNKIKEEMKEFSLNFLINSLRSE